MRRVSSRERRIAIAALLSAVAETIWETGDFTDAEGDILDHCANWSRRTQRSQAQPEREHVEQLCMHLTAEAFEHAARFHAMAKVA